jgi:hypothetical protein
MVVDIALRLNHKALPSKGGKEKLMSLNKLFSSKCGRMLTKGLNE